MFRARLSLIAVLAALLCTGCVHHLGGAKLPTKGWDKTWADCAELRQAVPTRPKLRIITCHSFWYADHAAIWVGSPSGLWAFWDPAGWLAGDFDWMHDKDDVICQPFDLQFYWCWRIGDYDGLDMLVFEWDITEKEARRIHGLLTSGCYKTATLPGFCCVNVANFMHNYLRVCIPPLWFSASPGLVGEQLWHEDPDRVIVFHKGRRTQIWRPQGRAGSGAALPPVPVAETLAPPVQTADAVDFRDASRLPAPGTLLPMDAIRPMRAR